MPEVMPISEWETIASKIPAQQVGEFEIVKKRIGRGQSLKMDEVFGYDSALFLAPATITVLREKKMPPKEVWMSDSPREVYSMHELSVRTKGPRVLIGGLGLGILANLIADRSDISEVVVIEKSPEVIKMVKYHMNPKVKVIEGDFLAPPRTLCDEHFDTVISDIYKSDKEKGIFEDAEMTMDDCWGPAVHLHWIFQRDLDDEIADMGMANIELEVRRCAESTCGRFYREGTPDFKKCVSDEMGKIVWLGIKYKTLVEREAGRILEDKCGCKFKYPELYPKEIP